MKNLSFLLTKAPGEGQGTLTVSLDDLGGPTLSNIKNYPGYVLPKDLYDHLSPKNKEAWDHGWRGYLKYFQK